MKRKLLIVLIFIFLFFQVNLVHAAPEPWGVALNHVAKECAGFWAGDEFIYYELPPGWQVFYPDGDSYNETTGLMIIETDTGTFNITSISNSNWYDKFCNETGYTYISKNIGIKLNSTGARDCFAIFQVTTLFITFLVCAIISLSLGIYITFIKKKSKIVMIIAFFSTVIFLFLAFNFCWGCF